ncbi:MAG: NADH-quinone oxidoreductase subunit M [Anaerolineae bacterium]|nr:NADH-quinone oxidoreductase subunit M [Anaerolineae bacterium]MDK1080752.1 NADH-quinone oxidoreductase subunit M [Anaerolineae bacterium]MDK1118077.1 NADH-quinone oxidoreductase subunit M [Anaerolineae bacterium]
MEFQFPILSVIVFIPIIAGVLMMLMPAERKNEVRIIALAAAVLALLLSIWVYITYDQNVAGYQFEEVYDWVPALGIGYHVGVDGMSIPLVLLTGVVMFTGVLISWGLDDRPREFFAILFLLATGVFGVFVSLDLFLLFFFYEIAVFPMYLLIAIWGWAKTREYAAMKLTLYLFVGSVIALVGILAMYFGSGLETFDMIKLEEANFSEHFQNIWFLPVFLGFAVLGGIWPFHNWSPDGHVAAPTAVSMFHAGVLMKLGAFAALRVGIMLLPQGAERWSGLIMVFAVIAVVYGALIAFMQDDLKYMIGFSSVSHMGLVMLGLSTLNKNGLTGAGVQMFSHGVMTALFFAVAGMIYDRAHTRYISELGGMGKIMPFAMIGFIIGGFVSMGMPGFSGFVAEFPIFMGVWQVSPWIAIIATTSIVITAAYILRNVRDVFFRPLPKKLEGQITDVIVLDKVAIFTVSALMIALGLFPIILVPMVQTGVDNILRLLGGA